MAPLLKQVASLAVRFGITPRDISEIVKRDCVSEAARLATLSNGRVNYSRVAIITGLSRVATKQLLTVESQSARADAATPQRAWRLISAWTQDPRFLNKRGEPRALCLGCSRKSFSELVRSYCGDVPVRAVLSELSRIGAIEISTSRVHLKKNLPRKMRHDISSVRHVLMAAGDILQQFGARSTACPPRHRTTTVSVRNSADIPVILRQIDTTIEAALEAVTALGRHPVTRGRRGRPSANHAIDVSAFVTTRLRPAHE